MKRPLDFHAFLEQLRAQKVYERPLEEGQYLGFFIPGEQVVLRRIEQMTGRKAPEMVACPVRNLFQ